MRSCLQLLSAAYAAVTAAANLNNQDNNVLCYDGAYYASSFNPYVEGSPFERRDDKTSLYDTRDIVSVPVPTLDSSDPAVDIVYPVAEEGATFRVVIYMHGNLASPPLGYYSHLLHDIASYGYVVVAPRCCRLGCVDEPAASEPKPNLLDPAGFGLFYEEAYKTIDWLESGDPALDAIPIMLGVGWGMAGHSMGGQAAAYACAFAGARGYDIRACVLHNAYHPRTRTPYEPIITDVPTFLTVGTNDVTAKPWHSRWIFNKATVPNKAMIVTKDKVHDEPRNDFYSDPVNGSWKLSLYTAAYFKVHFDGTRYSLGRNWENFFYKRTGNAPNFLCKEGPDKGMGDADECQVVGDAPTKSPSFAPTMEPATGSYYLGCGAAHRSCGGQTQEADVAETHELRCCSTQSLFGWNQYTSGCWGLSEIGTDGCIDAIDFNEGRRKCLDAGGDLCTLAQLQDNCSRGSGCGHDNDFIWSLDKVESP